MDFNTRMNRAMDFIEANLSGEIPYDRLARIACCSTYHFQRMFSFVTGVPLSEYIRLRRLTMAAFALRESSTRVIDVAFQYGYESPEAFSRAFKKMHGVMPTSARDKGTVFKAYPKITFSISIQGDAGMQYRIEQMNAFTLCWLSAVIDGRKMTPPKFMTLAQRSGRLGKLYSDLGVALLPEDAPATPNEPKSLYFALYGFKGDTFSYMIGHDLPKSGAPSGYETLSVPALMWAVFSSPEDLGG